VGEHPALRARRSAGVIGDHIHHLKILDAFNAAHSHSWQVRKE